jgi:hypothetical protein
MLPWQSEWIAQDDRASGELMKFLDAGHRQQVNPERRQSMQSLQLTAGLLSNGVIERDFPVGRSPALSGWPHPARWRALVLMGHVRGKHGTAPEMAGRAPRIVAGLLFHRRGHRRARTWRSTAHSARAGERRDAAGKGRPGEPVGPLVRLVPRPAGGVPLTAVEPRITAAVFGLFWPTWPKWQRRIVAAHRSGVPGERP